LQPKLLLGGIALFASYALYGTWVTPQSFILAVCNVLFTALAFVALEELLSLPFAHAPGSPLPSNSSNGPSRSTHPSSSNSLNQADSLIKTYRDLALILGVVFAISAYSFEGFSFKSINYRPTRVYAHGWPNTYSRLAKAEFFWGTLLNTASIALTSILVSTIWILARFCYALQLDPFSGQRWICRSFGLILHILPPKKAPLGYINHTAPNAATKAIVPVFAYG
jgi:hypothetical protein